MYDFFMWQTEVDIVEMFYFIIFFKNLYWYGKSIKNYIVYITFK